MNSTSIIALNPNENSMAIVELLVEQDCEGNTPLHLAKYLVGSGADSEIKNWKGNSPSQMVQQDTVNFLSHT